MVIGGSKQGSNEYCDAIDCDNTHLPHVACLYACHLACEPCASRLLVRRESAHYFQMEIHLHLHLRYPGFDYPATTPPAANPTRT